MLVEHILAALLAAAAGLWHGFSCRASDTKFVHGCACVESQSADSRPLLVFHSVPLWLMSETGLVGLVTGTAAFVCLAPGNYRLMRN